jgi:hypothetical protein
MSSRSKLVHLNRYFSFLNRKYSKLDVPEEKKDPAKASSQKGGKKGGKDNKFWTCNECGNINYGHRQNCHLRKCGAPRPIHTDLKTTDGVLPNVIEESNMKRKEFLMQTREAMSYGPNGEMIPQGYTGVSGISGKGFGHSASMNATSTGKGSFGKGKGKNNNGSTQSAGNLTSHSADGFLPSPESGIANRAISSTNSGVSAGAGVGGKAGAGVNTDGAKGSKDGV